VTHQDAKCSQELTDHSCLAPLEAVARSCWPDGLEIAQNQVGLAGLITTIIVSGGPHQKVIEPVYVYVPRAGHAPGVTLVWSESSGILPLTLEAQCRNYLS
jgi:hypothetical protein